MSNASEVQTRAGFVAVLGAPNAGKSTLVNRIVGQKVSIVTHKVQTTRFPIRGVAMRAGAQLVLVDTPGVFAPKRRLDRAMVRAAWAGAEEADVRLHVVDAAAEIGASPADVKAAEDALRVTEGLKTAGGGAVLALNKIDQLPRDRLLALAQRFYDSEAYAEVFMISASNGDGVDDLVGALAARVPPGPWLYPEDQAADLPLRLMASEITREKVFLRLHDEIPYRSTVETESWEERADGSVRIQQTLFVERDSQRKIALGKGGASIKAIGQSSREELQSILDRPVHLFLFVKVRDRWDDDRARYLALGLDYEA